MKYQVVRKRLVIETVAVMSGLVLGVAALFLLISMHEESEAEKLTLQTRVTESSNELASLNDKYIKLQKHHDIYEEAKQKNQSDQLVTSPELIRRLLKEYGSRYHFRAITLDMSAPFRSTNAAYTRKSANIIYNEVTVTFDALTDQDVYDLINAIHRDFTGAVKITSLELKRDSQFTKETAQKIATDGHMRMVGAIVKFNWFGIEPVETPDNSGGKPNAG